MVTFQLLKNIFIIYLLSLVGFKWNLSLLDVFVVLNFFPEVLTKWKLISFCSCFFSPRNGRCVKEPGLLKGDWGRPKLWFEWLEGPPLGTKLRELDGFVHVSGRRICPIRIDLLTFSILLSSICSCFSPCGLKGNRCRTLFPGGLSKWRSLFGSFWVARKG